MTLINGYKEGGVMFGIEQRKRCKNCKFNNWLPIENISFVTGKSDKDLKSKCNNDHSVIDCKYYESKKVMRSERNT